MNTTNNVLVDVTPLLFFEAYADSEAREEVGHEGDGDGNDAESRSQVTSVLTCVNSVEMDVEEEEEEEEVVTGEKEDHDEEEVNSHGRLQEKREDEFRRVDSTSTGNDERLRKKIENDRMFWEACLAS